ncbi:MAG: diguanylate cyclase, partial [Bacillota bacterium]|nr:diguanylate cyclase [Bacillota bacterium]
MKLSHKLTAILAAGSVFLVITFNLLFGYYFNDCLLGLEKEQVASDTKSAASFFADRESHFLAAANDWGHWDDTYEFIKTGNPEYAKLNLTKSDFNTLGLNFMAFYDRNNKIVNGTYFDLDKNDYAAFDKELLKSAESFAMLNKKNGGDSRVIKNKDRFYIIASSEVTDSLKKMPPNGTLVIGRRIEKNLISELEARTGGKIYLSSLSDLKKGGRDPFEPGGGGNILADRKNKRITDFIYLSDAEAEDPVILTLQKDMKMYASGKAKIPLFNTASALIIVMVFLALLRMQNNNILKPMTRVTEKLEKFDLDAGEFESLPVTGKNELAVLCAAVNKMLEKITADRKYLQRSISRLDMAQDIAHIGNWEFNIEKKQFWVSDEAFRIYGATPNETGFLTDAADSFLLPEYYNLVHEKFNNLLSKREKYEAEYKIRRKNDLSVRWVFATGEYMEDEDGAKAVGVIQDITEIKKREEIILFNGYHDELTGLYNRQYLKEQTGILTENGTSPISVIVGDVNGLKLLNDAFGYQTGDRILREIGAIMESCLRAEDITARWGGDEFVVLMPGVDAKGAKRAVQKIKAEFSAAKIDSISLSVSLGCCTGFAACENIPDIIKKAENEMYQNKLVETPSMRGKAIDTILSTLFEKNPREEQHSRRVSELCCRIG